MKKNNCKLPFMILVLLIATIFSCKGNSTEKIIERVSEEYKNEYGSDIIMNIEREVYRGKEIYRLTGWTERETEMFTEIDPDEWTLIFYSDNDHQLIKGTAYRPMDSIIKYNKVKCISDFKKTK